MQGLTIEVVCDLQLVTKLHSPNNVQFCFNVANSCYPPLQTRAPSRLHTRARTHLFLSVEGARSLVRLVCKPGEQNFWPNVVGVVVRALDPRGHKKAKNARSMALLLLPSS